MLSTTESERRGRDLLMRLGVAGFSMMNIMLLSIAVWSGAERCDARSFPLDQRDDRPADAGFRRATRFFASALASLRARRLGMCRSRLR